MLFLVACAAPKPVEPLGCPPPAPAARAPEVAADLDDAQVKAKSHAFLDAFDRASAADIQDVLAPSFVSYEEARFYDHDLQLKSLRNRAAQHQPIRSRTYGEERVYRGGNSAVYIGMGVEHVPADGEQPAYDEPGANTLVWVRNGTQWTLALWQWDPTGPDVDRARWDRWLVNGHFNRQPNQTLVDAVKGRKPGAALDVASGQGRNAVFLASQGWKTTALDTADVGLELTRRDATAKKLKVETVQQDVNAYDYGTNKWDLVAMIYAPGGMRLVEKIKPAIKKGGLFVTELFAADGESAKAGGEGWDIEALKAAFKDWKIVRAERIEDNADWAGQRKTMLVRFVAEKQ
ncbi:MAG: DUF4440 domain-containing protein [Deltaproteobacteria bacterium]|nr:DUF4440 domain-containing protein [Deltaproteobacteria bacterium]